MNLNFSNAINVSPVNFKYGFMYQSEWFALATGQ